MESQTSILGRGRGYDYEHGHGDEYEDDEDGGVGDHDDDDDDDKNGIPLEHITRRDEFSIQYEYKYQHR